MCIRDRYPIYLLPPDDKIFIKNKIHAEGAVEKFVNYTDDVRDVTARKIKTFNQIHFLLYSSYNLIAKYFSLQLFLCTVALSLHVITLFINLFDTDLNHSPQRASTVIFIVFNCTFVFSVANVCHKIQSEVRNNSMRVTQSVTHLGLSLIHI